MMARIKYGLKIAGISQLPLAAMLFIVVVVALMNPIISTEKILQLIFTFWVGCSLVMFIYGFLLNLDEV